MVYLCAKLVRIDEERLMPVAPTLFENVQAILNSLNGDFKGRRFFTKPDWYLLLHVGNIPRQYGAN